MSTGAGLSTLPRNRTSLTTECALARLCGSHQRRKERKQFCAFSARARFHSQGHFRKSIRAFVRSTSALQSGHRQVAPACPFRANRRHSGLGLVSKKRPTEAA
jgi:hypothetical protein